MTAASDFPAVVEQLRRHYNTPCPTLEQVRADYLPHITSERHLLSEIKRKRIKLVYTKLHSSHSRPVVFIGDLARWLCSCDPSNTSNTHTAAHQAAINSKGDTA